MVVIRADRNLRNHLRESTLKALKNIAGSSDHPRIIFTIDDMMI